MQTIYLIIITLTLCLATSAKHSNLKIMGGKLAEPGQFPSIVSIIWNKTTEWYFGSAGSIINENWILTTAINAEYYNFEPKDLVVVSGTNQPYTDGGTNYGVSQIVVHPKFNISTFENNIALFKIEGSIAFADLIQPIELGEVSINDSVVVAGFGFSESGTEFGTLRYAGVSTWSNEECNTKVEDSSLVGPGEVCAFGGKGICFTVGDSGAPLIFNGTLVGLASRDIHGGCVAPDIYTRVGFLNDWINEVVGKS